MQLTFDAKKAARNQAFIITRASSTSTAGRDKSGYVAVVALMSGKLMDEVACTD
jgi:hypothetical protein